MTSYQVRVLRWITVLAVLIIAKISSADQRLNHFDLGNLSQSRSSNPKKTMKSEQAIENLRTLIRANLDDRIFHREHHLILNDDEAIRYRDAVVEVVKNGENMIHLCNVEKEFDFNSGDDACLEKINDLSLRGHLMAEMNASKGRFVRFNKHSMPTVDQVRAIYPFFTQDNHEGLVFYLGVSSNGQDPVGLLDPARDFGALGSEWNNTFSHVGAIYVIKLGHRKN